MVQWLPQGCCWPRQPQKAARVGTDSLGEGRVDGSSGSQVSLAVAAANNVPVSTWAVSRRRQGAGVGPASTHTDSEDLSRRGQALKSPSRPSLREQLAHQR